MKLLILFVASVTAAPQGYNLSPPTGPSFTAGACGAGQVRHVDGRCVTPRVTRRVFLYDVPANIAPSGPPPNIPDPTIETNIIFIRTPEGLQGPEPIVVPPPQQDQQVIEVPAPPATNPEVYFVNYADGENPTLPSGVDLQTALGAATQGGGQTIGGIVGGSGGGGYGGGSGSGGGFSIGSGSGGYGGGSGSGGGFSIGSG